MWNANQCTHWLGGSSRSTMRRELSPGMVRKTSSVSSIAVARSPRRGPMIASGRSRLMVSHIGRSEPQQRRARVRTHGSRRMTAYSSLQYHIVRDFNGFLTVPVKARRSPRRAVPRKMSDAGESVVLGMDRDDSVLVEIVGYASHEPIFLHLSDSFAPRTFLSSRATDTHRYYRNLLLEKPVRQSLLEALAVEMSPITRR